MVRPSISPWVAVFLLLILLAGGLSFFWMKGWLTKTVAQRVEDLLQEKKWEEADKILAQSGQSLKPEVRQILLARVRIGQGRPEGALNALEKLPGEARGSIEARIIAGKAHLSLGNASRALELFDLAVQENPQDSEANRGLAGALYDLGALDQAFRVLVTSLKERPDPVAFRFAGQIAKELGNTEDAASYLARALESPNWPPKILEELALDLLDVQLERNDTVHAAATWEGPAKPLPPTARKAGLGGKLKIYQGQLDEAARLLDEARKLDPALPWIARLRGQVWLDQGNAAEAVPLLEFATSEDPLDTLAWNQKALALERQGLKDRAQVARAGLDQATANLKKMTELNQVANNQPADVQTRLELARLCQEVKRPKLAKSWERAAQEASLFASDPPLRGGAGKQK